MADFDDSKDKVRRNLVSFSAALLIANFIGLNIRDPELSPIGKIASTIDHPENFRIAIFLIWCYLAYRFAASIPIKTNIISTSWRFYKDYVAESKQRIAEKSIEKTLYDKRTWLASVTFKQSTNVTPPKIIDKNIIITVVHTHKAKITFDNRITEGQIYEYSLNRIPFGLAIYLTDSKKYNSIELQTLRSALEITSFPSQTGEDEIPISTPICAAVKLSGFGSCYIYLHALFNTLFSTSFSETAVGSIIGLAGGIAVWFLK